MLSSLKNTLPPRECRNKDWTCLHGLKSASSVSFSCDPGTHQSCLVCFRRHGECRGCPPRNKSDETGMLKWRKAFGSSVEQSLPKCPFPRCRAYMLSSETESHMKQCPFRPFACTEPYRRGMHCDNLIPYLGILRHLIEYHSLEVRVLQKSTNCLAETKEEILVPALLHKGHPERYAPKLFRIHGRYFLRKVAVIQRKCTFCFCLADGGEQEAKKFQLIVKICHGKSDTQVVWETPIPCLRTAEELDQHFSNPTVVPMPKNAFAFDCFPVQNVKQRSTVYTFHYTVLDDPDDFHPNAANIRLMRPHAVPLLWLRRTVPAQSSADASQEVESTASNNVELIGSLDDSTQHSIPVIDLAEDSGDKDCVASTDSPGGSCPEVVGMNKDAGPSDPKRNKVSSSSSQSKGNPQDTDLPESSDEQPSYCQL